MTDVMSAIYNRIVPAENAIQQRWIDLIDNKPKEKEKTGDEIAAEIIEKFKLKQKEQENGWCP